MNSLFKFGGGAGIGSYVIVIENGTLKSVRAEVVRESYDKGENLYLSIIDDSTEEALLPLSGYVDNEGILHLSGRDFDDNKTYEFTVNNAEQTISVEEKEGVTIGETTIPTSGGGSEVPTFEASTFNINPPAGTFELELAEEDIADIIENAYPIIKISYNNSGSSNIVWPFILSASQASVSVIYSSVTSAMNLRFLLDFALQAGQIVSSSAAIINTSNIVDIKVDNTSVVDQTGNVNLVTKTAYDPATNKLVTEADIGGGGGISLYSHHVLFSTDDEIYFISTSPTSITLNTIDDILDKPNVKTVGVPWVSSANNGSGPLAAWNGAVCTYVDSEVGGTENLNLQAATIVSDTVTQL